MELQWDSEKEILKKCVLSLLEFGDVFLSSESRCVIGATLPGRVWGWAVCGERATKMLDSSCGPGGLHKGQ